MAVQPLNKTKIIKKVTKHANRFHSDRYHRVGVSTECDTLGRLLGEACQARFLMVGAN